MCCKWKGNSFKTNADHERKLLCSRTNKRIREENISCFKLHYALYICMYSINGLCVSCMRTYSYKECDGMVCLKYLYAIIIFMHIRMYLIFNLIFNTNSNQPVSMHLDLIVCMTRTLHKNHYIQQQSRYVRV